VKFNRHTKLTTHYSFVQCWTLNTDACWKKRRLYLAKALLHNSIFRAYSAI